MTTAPDSRVEDEPDAQSLPWGDGHGPAGLLGMQATLGRRADQVGAGMDSQFVLASVISSSGGYDVTVVQRFDHRFGHWAGVGSVGHGQWIEFQTGRVSRILLMHL